MFESSVLPRQANKAALADALREEVKNGEPESVPEGQLHTVMDGGALLHRLPWQRGSTFEQLCEMYVNYVSKQFGKSTICF